MTHRLNLTNSKFTRLGVFVWAFPILISILVAGCSSTPSLSQRVDVANQITQAKGWQSSIVRTSAFNLQTYTKPISQTNYPQTLTVYIEGDGHAWDNSQTPSDDPTPIDPIALRLAVQDSSNAVAYLGRPCQYVEAEKSRNCQEAYWTNKRFSLKAINSIDEAITQLKERYHAKTLILVGYSGGATVALLLAAQRTDVVKVISVAGNVDTQAWVKYHAISPLSGSLNPATFIDKLSNVPQVLYVGGKDDIVPLEVTQSYVDRFPKDRQPKVILVKDYGHVCCWAKDWERLERGFH